ncbi:MAG: cysteine synthase A [Thalassolituus sp.]|jgi:cysteine synthase A|uniref:Cysteine synthase n=2 Tax=root TaxID=1 RepID=M5DNF7_9GAMM|nr:cysteine synthase A [Thalassolituus oleivorans]PCI48791.1 MAG: cysteine synthase A [Oceanospirillales bacterium]PHQ87919.1 MAG: cysteine synthase A [Thalassobium sp.]AHK16357.1 cysteine synthase [Thalassolituus oleivorans R6-15]APR67753.1 cysteine synthase A [Thalassolituus oleivorans]MBQ0728624.1 cysteine synthase A [Thalassolituus oleivorans]
MKVYDDISQSVGNTPLVRINKLTSHPHVYAKLESRNPAQSVKCRIGANMIWQAEKDGVLKPGMEIVEPTSGNTGIALAFVGAARGYKVTLTMPETMSMERRKVMQALGANLVLTEGAKGMKGAVDAAQALVDEDPNQRIILQQFNNPANPAIHELTTGPEIWNDTDGLVDIVVAGVGTGGTITGISRFLKQHKAVTSVAVEPADSPIITQTRNGEEIKPGPHKIQGIGANFIPGNLDIAILDRVEQVSNDDAMKVAHELMSKEGILAGISCGAAMTAALRVAAEPENAEKVIVVILPDSGERYLTSPLFEGFFK